MPNIQHIWVIADLQVFIQQGAVHYPTRWRAQKLHPMLHMLGDLFVVTSNLILMVGKTPNVTSPPMDWPTVWFCAWGLVVWNPIESSYERDDHELGYRYPCSKTANPICRWIDFDSCMNILTMEIFDVLFESVHIPFDYWTRDLSMTIAKWNLIQDLHKSVNQDLNSAMILKVWIHINDY